ncbi:MAG: putative toxin-antitoxin system toxin component, PIN family [bacterium]|nr:putative toxin-antitoxin system toxin component, PIN family [bacterium]
MNKENKSAFQVVPDTNVILSSEISNKQNSPNKEFIERWLNREFTVLFSHDTKIEYTIKLREKGIPKEMIVRFLANLSSLGDSVYINNYHLPYYPEDEDDICFILCAENGNATHLVSYDMHLLTLDGKYKFEILKIIPFLKMLRRKL